MKALRPATDAEIKALEGQLRRRSHIEVAPVRGLLARYRHTEAELSACRAELCTAASGGAAPPAEGQRP